MKIGLNLFSIRNLIQTETDFLETAQTLKANGCSYLQYSGAPYNPEMLQRVSAQTGLPIVLTHVPMDRIIGDTEALMKEHALFNCKNIGLGSMPDAIIKDEIACKETIEKLNAAAKKMQDNGFKFFYHHHHFEFLKYGGQTIFDYIIQNAPFINFTLDTYWLQYGGADIIEKIKQLKGRVECVHLKDYQMTFSDEKFQPAFAPLGDGVLDFKKIVQAMQESGVKYFLIEQDNAALLPDSIQPILKSLAYATTAL